MKRIFISVVSLFVLFFTPCMKAFSASRLYYENFDDQIIHQPAVGSISIYKDFNFTTINPPDYNLTGAGRGGAGYCFSGAQNTSAWLFWNYGQTWPTDEMYVSFWERYANYTYTDSNENFKTFYPHWGSRAYYCLQGRGTDCLNIATSSSQGDTDNHSYCQPGISGMYDGNWHHYEIWLKFSTGQSKLWYDGNLVADFTLAVGTWDRFNYYTTLGSADSEEPGTFLRQYDDWEVWDGMPGQDSEPPASPSGLKLID